MFKDGLLKGQRILVTGGGTGLGKEMATRFLELGAELFICGRRKSVCDATAFELADKTGGQVTSYGVDIRNAAAVDEMIEDIFRSGPLTGLVNNAAGNFISRTEDLSPKGFDAIANIVMHGTFYVTHAVGKRWIAGKHQRQRRVDRRDLDDQQRAVHGAVGDEQVGDATMTRSLAVEWGRYGIRLNAIAPGVFPTEGAASGCGRARSRASAPNRSIRWAASARCRNCRTSRRSCSRTAARG